MLRQMFLHALAGAAAIMVTALLLPAEVRYRDYTSIALFAGILGLLNALLTPLLNLLTLPLACLTLGLFRIVVNIGVFLLAAQLVPEGLLQVTPMGAAVGALVAGVASALLTLLLGEGR